MVARNGYAILIQDVKFKCRNGMRVAKNFELEDTSIGVVCLTGNAYDLSPLTGVICISSIPCFALNAK